MADRLVARSVVVQLAAGTEVDRRVVALEVRMAARLRPEERTEDSSAVLAVDMADMLAAR